MIAESAKPQRALRADWPALAALWEASVRATHHFLAEADIQSIRARLEPDYFPQVELWVVRGTGGEPLAFLGAAVDAGVGRVEMLFVHPAAFGHGHGTRLLRHAVEELGACEVDVNEQNPAALAFYQSRGFTVSGRSERDGQGRPYPLLHLRLSCPKGEPD